MASLARMTGAGKGAGAVAGAGKPNLNLNPYPDIGFRFYRGYVLSRLLARAVATSVAGLRCLFVIYKVKFTLLSLSFFLLIF